MPKIPTDDLVPFWQTADRETVRLYLGDVIDVLRRMPAKSVQTVVTSPPYWGLRDYGTGKSLEIGSEKTPEEYVRKIVAVFREVRRVLRDDGTLWLNLGDSYACSSAGNAPGVLSGFAASGIISVENSDRRNREGKDKTRVGIPSGNLVGIPWRVALALQADGWVLRQDIIWHKPSPMPESVKNRCTKAHEYVFLFAKRMGYYYDAEAVKTDCEPSFRFIGTATNVKTFGRHLATGASPSGNMKPGGVMSWSSGSNKRDVWTVSPQGYEGAHFATFPPNLIEPCILAGTSEKGCCAKCGAPWRRVIIRQALTRKRLNEYVKRTGEKGTGNRCSNSVAGVEVKTVGWEPTCECFGRFVKRRRIVRSVTGDGESIPRGWAVGEGSHDTVNAATAGGRKTTEERRERAVNVRAKRRVVTVRRYVPRIPLEDHPVVPCVVLDPFIGSGTTAVVCIDKGRRCWGIDLSEEYLRQNAVVRIEGELLRRPGLAGLIGREAKRVGGGKRSSIR